nr:MAG TPA: hypothetical protein [Caudoviricetes sp.]
MPPGFGRPALRRAGHYSHYTIPRTICQAKSSTNLILLFFPILYNLPIDKINLVWYTNTNKRKGFDKK